MDTNVLVRMVVGDDAAQHALAHKLLRSGEPLLIAPGVLLEAEWVLRDVYGLSPVSIASAFETLCAARNVEVVQAAAVAEALRLFAGGVGFADAIHLSLAADAGASALISFDRVLARRARKLGATIPVNSP